MKTHCKNNHEFTTENTYIRPDGHSRCRQYAKKYNRKWAESSRPCESRKEYMRKYWIKYQYSIDSEQLEHMVDSEMITNY